MSIKNKQKIKLAIFASHPIQYQVPFYRELAKEELIDLKVFFCSDKGLKEYKDKGFGKNVKWDILLLEGYNYEFLQNISPVPNSTGFWGLINPSMVEKIKKEKLDAIWIHGWNRFTDWLCMVIAFIRSVPVLLRGESNLLPEISSVKSILKRFILENLFKRITAFLAIGKYNTAFYKYYGVPEEKIFLVPYVVNNDFFISKANELLPRKSELKKKYNIPPHLPVILFSGKLIDVKKPIDLLMAQEQLSKEIEVGVVFVGDGNIRKYLEEYAIKNNLKHVYFMGFRNQTELPEFYSMADVFVLPSSFEPWGLVVNEAMCFSLPVIVSDQVGAGGDLIKEGVNGFVYPKGDISMLSEKLKVLLKDEKLRQSFGIRSKEIIEKWSYKKGVEGVIRSLQSLKKKSY